MRAVEAVGGFVWSMCVPIPALVPDESTAYALALAKAMANESVKSPVALSVIEATLYEEWSLKLAPPPTTAHMPMIDGVDDPFATWPVSRIR